MKNTDKPISKIKTNIISKKAPVIWRIRATAALIAAAFPVGALFAFHKIAALIFGAFVIITYVILILFYFPVLYKSCRYFIGESLIEIKKGVFFRKHTQIGFPKIQYCVFMQGPIQKIFGVCSVRLLTAGSFEIMRDISAINGKKIKLIVEQER